MCLLKVYLLPTVLAALLFVCGFYAPINSYAGDKSFNSASISYEEAEELLTKIVQADFEALDGGGERIGNVVISGSTVLPYGPRAGFYMLDWDAIYVAESWRLLERKPLEETLIEYSIEFHMVGRTLGDGAKNIVPYTQSKEVIYKLKKTSDGWKIIDPPAPVIGIDSLERFYQKERERFSVKINSMKDRGLEPHQNLVVGLRLAIQRLNDIKVLRK